MKSIFSAVLAASLLSFGANVFAQDAVGNGVPQPKSPKAEKMTAEQCAARTPGDAKDPKEKSQARYCKRVLKKAAKKTS
jgi:hypothetical protein